MTDVAEIRGDQLPPRLTIERDLEDRVAPSAALVAARESGEWVPFDFFDPMVGGSGILQAKAVTKYREAREVLSKPGVRMGVLASAEEGSTAGNPGFLLYLEGDDHRRVRSVLMKHFDAKRVRSMAPEIERVVDELLDRLEEQGGAADLVPTFTSQIPALVVSYLMGAPYEDTHDLERWSAAQVDMNLSTEEVFAAVAKLKDYTVRRYQDAKANPGDDLMSALAHDYSETLSEEEVIGLAFNIFSAAMDTTARFATLAILSILRYPDQLAVVREAGEVTDAMVEELLRYLSPATSAQQRYVIDDVVVGENSVPAGERYMVSLLSANWDPEFVGDNPGLDLTRKKLPHVAFSYGTHACGGQHLARLEMKIALTKIFQRFPNLQLDCDIQDLEWLENDQIYGVTSLPVRW